MKSYKDLVFRYMKKEKKSTASIFISIVLSITLLTTVVFISQNYLFNAFKAVKINNGDYDLIMKNIDENELSKIEASENIKDFAIVRDEGSLATENIKVEYGVINKIARVDILGLDEKAMKEYLNINVLEGRLPEAANEVVIQKSVVDSLGKNYSVGDTITGDLRVNRTTNEYNEGESIRYAEKDPYERDKVVEADITSRTEELISKPGEYKIVGIVSTGEGNRLLNNKMLKLLTPEELAQKGNELKVLTYLQPGVSEKEIAEEVGIEYLPPLWNSDLYQGRPGSDVAYPGYHKSNYESIMQNAMARNIVIVSILFSYIALYNTFNSSTQKRIRYYGILRAVGAEIKQIGALIYTEAIILYLLAIPLGVLLGLGLNKLEVFSINRIMGTLGDYKVTFDLEAILITLGSVLIITCLAVYSALRKEKSMTPLEAINDSNGMCTTKMRKVKRMNKHGEIREVMEQDSFNDKALLEVLAYEKTTPLYKIIKKIFRFEGELAHKNINRNYKANRVSKLMLIITMSLMIFFFMQIVTGGLNADESIQSSYWDITMGSSNKPIESEEISKIENVDGVEKVYKDMQVITPIIVKESSMDERLKHAMEFDNFDLGDKGGYNGEFGIIAKIRGLDEVALNEYTSEVKSGIVDKEALDNGGIILVNKATNYYLEKIARGDRTIFVDTNPTLNYEPGDTLEVALNPTLIKDSISGRYISETSLQDYRETDGPTVKTEVVGTIDGDLFSDNKNIRSASAVDSNVVAITSEKGFAKITGIDKNSNVYIKTVTGEKRNETVKELKKMAVLNSYDIQDELGAKYEIIKNNKEKVSLNIMIAITIIGMALLNLVNTSIANINSRTRELAASRAIGMSDRQQTGMIISEGLTLSISAGIVTLITTGIFSLATQGEKIGVGKVNPGYLILGYLIIVILMVIISNIVTLIPLNKVKKINIVESLKDS